VAGVAGFFFSLRVRGPRAVLPFPPHFPQRAPRRRIHKTCDGESELSPFSNVTFVVQLGRLLLPFWSEVRTFFFPSRNWNDPWGFFLLRRFLAVPRFFSRMMEYSVLFFFLPSLRLSIRASVCLFFFWANQHPPAPVFFFSFSAESRVETRAPPLLLFFFFFSISRTSFPTI